MLQPSPRYAITMQLGERDYELAQRLLEERGLLGMYVQGIDGEKFVVTDDPAQLLPNLQLVKWRPNNATPDVPAISSWSSESQEVPGIMSLTAWNPEAPLVSLYVQEDVLGKLPGETGNIFDLGRYGTVEEGNEQLRIALEEQACRRDIKHGASNVPDLACGLRIGFEPESGVRPPVRSVAESFLVLSVQHHGTGAGPDQDGEYHNTFTAIPTTTRFRPSRELKKPTIPGTMFATVVTADADDEAAVNTVAVDEKGRVFLRFYWQHGKNRKLAVPARVSQFWAGAGFGAWFPPRVGQEVIVTFDRGEPELPLVIGCVYFEEFVIALPINRPLVGIVSQTVPGGGTEYKSQISLDDTPGEESVTLASRALHTKVGTDKRTIVKGSDFEEVDGDQYSTVKGTIHAHLGGCQTVVDGTYAIKAKHIVLEGIVTIHHEGVWIQVGSDAIRINGLTLINCDGGTRFEAQFIQVLLPQFTVHNA